MDPTSDIEWESYRDLGHQIIDIVIEKLQHIRNEPVWTKMPNEVRERHQQSITFEGDHILNVFQEFKESILPYGSGNIHPGFMGWVQGGGNIAAIIGDLLTSCMNMNCGGRDHVGIALELQIIQWVREWFHFPTTSRGVFVTGSSMANFISVITARHWYEDIHPVDEIIPRYVVYTSVASHRCIQQAVSMSGMQYSRSTNNNKRIGGIRKIPVTADHKMNVSLLEEEIIADKSAGLTPLLVVATAGTVDVGAVDDLGEISRICKQFSLWLHIDGAYGALGVLSSHVKPLLKGIELADSIAFDFHKWGQVQYDAGMIIVRNGDALRDTFSSPASYLSREADGMMAGEYWPCDYGLDLSRSCRALKTWFTIKTYGIERIGHIITTSCELAQELKSLVLGEESLELLAPVSLNIVCFRYIHANILPNDNPLLHLNEINRSIVRSLHAAGRVTPSMTTTLDGIVAIRAALFNHRTKLEDVECLVRSVVAIGMTLVGNIQNESKQGNL